MFSIVYCPTAPTWIIEFRPHHGGYLGSDPNPPLNLLGPVGCVGGGGGVLGGLGGPPGWGLGYPNIYLKMILIALIILNTHMWGFLRTFFPLGGSRPSNQVWEFGWGRSVVIKIFMFSIHIVPGWQ